VELRERGAKEAPLLLIADADDPEASGLVDSLRGGLSSATWLPLAVEDGDFAVSIAANHFEVRSGDVKLSDTDFAEAHRVLVRRWRQYWTAPVLGTFPASDVQHVAFAEREWEAALAGLLFRAHLDRGTVEWSSAPRLLSLAFNRLALLILAERSGFEVPEWQVTSRALDVDPDRQFVVKAINCDERVDRTHVLGANLISGARICHSLEDSRSAPVFMQRYIKREVEWRIIAIFGEILCFEQRALADTTDLRNVPRSDVKSSVVPVPDALIEPIEKFTAITEMSLCAFDVVGGDGNYFLVDVTPNGGWAYMREMGVMGPVTQIARALNVDKSDTP